MPLLTAEEFHRLLSSGGSPELILLFGQEPYLIKQAVKKIRRAVLTGTLDEFNDHQFQGDHVTAAQILEAARTLPVFAEKKLVTISRAGNLSAAELDPLLDYLQSPAPETCLLLIAEKIDSRRKFFQQFKKYGVLVEFKPLTERKIPQFVRQTLEQQNIAIAEDALTLFCSAVGSGLHEIMAELDKLISYIGQERVIDVKDVKAVVSWGRMENVFHLGQAVGCGDAAVALRLVVRLSESGEPALRILSLLVRHFRQLWKIRELEVRKYPHGEIAKLAGVPFFVVDQLIQQAKRFSRKDFIFAYEAFLETDLAMKSSGADVDALLERLVMTLISTRKTVNRSSVRSNN